MIELMSVIVVVAVIAHAVLREFRNRPVEPRKLDGWWHQQERSMGRQPWMPLAWRDACRQSLERSRQRRLS